MRNGLISVDAYKKSRAFYIYERKLRYCIEVFFRVRKRASGNASMEKVLCVSVLVKFPRAETRAFLPQWKAGLIAVVANGIAGGPAESVSGKLRLPSDGILACILPLYRDINCSTCAESTSASSTPSSGGKAVTEGESRVSRGVCYRTSA